jgi:hypothetical protein
MISFKDEDLFYRFYEVLTQMSIKDFSSDNKISHLIQIPMDLFFCNYLHKLYPEDMNRDIDLSFFVASREKIYMKTRNIMIKNTIINSKRPLFIVLDDFPYLLNNYNTPEWNMSLKEIRSIMLKSNLSKIDLFKIFKFICETDEICVNKKLVKLDYFDFVEKHSKNKIGKLLNIISELLYNYLQHYKKIYENNSGKIYEDVLNLSKREDVKSIGQILKSNIALEILLLADGSRNTTQISRQIGKSVATISTYASRLKKSNFIRLLPNGKLKRNIKGIKINLDVGM